MLVYAIDFGTSNSLLAAADEKNIYPPIALDAGAVDPTVLRSVLYFPSGEKVFYGSKAIEEFRQNYGTGRLIRSIKKQLPLKSFIGTYIGDRPTNLEDLIGFFLAEMRRRANQHFGQDVKSVVLGRPARFSNEEAADKFAEFRLGQAAKRAGFEHIEFCAEPLAAAYEFAATLDEPRTVLVGDFGGGTSDFTVIRIKNSKAAEVLALGGVSVAGDKFDGAVMRKRLVKYFGAGMQYQVPFGTNVLTMPGHLMEKLCSPADISLLAKRDATEFFNNIRKWAVKEEEKTKLDHLQILIDDQQGFPIFESIQTAKISLSDNTQTTIDYSYHPIEIHEPIARTEFESYAQGEIDAILASLDETVKESGLRPDQIDLVCLTGGTAQVPAIQRGLIERFGAQKMQQRQSFHAVTLGLAHRAHEIAKGYILS